MTTFAVGAVATALFLAWETRRDDPMLDLRLFRHRAFSVASVALAMLFFAMAGAVFLQAQYLQFILDYTPLAAGFALVPAAIGIMVGTGAGAHLGAMAGSRVAVATGTLLAAAGLGRPGGLRRRDVLRPHGHRPPAVRPRRRHRHAGGDRPHHGHPAAGPGRRRLRRQRHRPGAGRGPGRRRHRQRRGHGLHLDACAPTSAPSPS